MRPEEAWRSTPREIAIVLKAAQRQEGQAARMATVCAWQTAALMRTKRLPKLASLLKDRQPRQPQSPEQQRAIFLDIAHNLGLKVERHEKPVV